MSGDRPMPAGCEAFSEELLELALGTLMSRQRAAVLAHVGTCPGCTAEVEQLSRVVDELLLQAPLAEPSVGFEARVFDRLNLHPQRPKGVLRSFFDHRGLGATMATAVVVAVFVVGLALGHGATSAAPGGHVAQVKGTPVQTAELTSAGHSEGAVIVYVGTPTWLFMYVDNPAWKGELRCEVTFDHGPTLILGEFRLSNGDGTWATKLSAPAGRLAQARVVSPDGTVLATAILS